MGGVRVLKASAGSGKTFRLAYEYVRSVIDEPSSYRSILAVTFTNKATEEMKQRIVSEINMLANGVQTLYLEKLESELGLSPQLIRHRAAIARTRILHDYSHFAILTIDKFFQRIIRSFIKELGIDLNFNLELQTDTLLSSASDGLIEDIATDEALKRWITEFVEEKIAESRVWDIKSELSRLGKEIFKESYKRTSAAASSKEELWKIVSQANAKSHAIEASIRQTAQKALEIMAERNLSLEDFPYGKSGFANYFYKSAAGEIAPPTARALEAMVNPDKWTSKKSPRAADITDSVALLRPLLEQLCDTYTQNIRYMNSAALLRENFRNYALLTDLAQKISNLCTTGNIMPISETNSILNKLISGNDTPFIFEKAGNHYSQFMIDEFQDTSAMQWENFVPLLHNATSQSEHSPVLLVGDVKQSIYRWRGGDWQILSTKIQQEFDDTKSENLEVNFRSMSNVVEFNNRIVAGCVAGDNIQLNIELEAAREKGYITAAYADSMRDLLAHAYQEQEQRASKTAQTGYVNITRYGVNSAASDSISPLPPIISRIEELQQRGYAPSDIAILVRFNYEGVAIANMLLDYKSRNPESPYSYDVVTAEALTIGSSPVVRFVVACLALSTDTADTIKRAVFNRWLGAAFDCELTEAEQQFMRELRLQPPLEAFESVVVRYSLNERSEDIAYLQAFHQQIITFSSSTISDISLFLKWWNESGSQQSVNIPQSRSAITIISVHKAKGLQYPAVIIPYCDWGLAPSDKTVLWADCNGSPFEGLSAVPIRFKKSMAESYFATEYIDELILSHIDNINIFYVAVTRAQQELHIMIPERGRRSGRVSDLIMGCIAVSRESAVLGDMAGHYSVDTPLGLEMTEFGQKVTNISRHSDEQSVDASFRSGESASRVRLRLPTQRYTEDGAAMPLSPRSQGVLLHKVFENVTDIADIEPSVRAMEQSGELSTQEGAQLRAAVARALHNPVISEWFDSKWQAVRNENSIIIPGSNQQQRPDRVVISGEKAIVVDYKFGVKRNPRYARQIEQYMSLLAQMGYSDVKGYIWYVTMGEVEQCLYREPK